MTPLDVLNYTELRENLAKVMDEVTQTGSHVIVTRQKSRPVVVMSYDEYRSIAETLYLMSNRKSARELMDAMDELDRGEGITTTFEEMKAMVSEVQAAHQKKRA